MRNYLLGGIAIASAFTFMIQSAPVSAQGGCGIGHPCSSYRAAGAGPTQFRYQHQGYTNNYGRAGYGIGVGAAALATGLIIGGAMQQNQGYDPAESYPVYSDPVYSDQGPLFDDAGPQLVNDGDSTAYCQQTYRSYDPASGTYLGYDGLRHPCP
jgi:hypothetical protein